MRKNDKRILECIDYNILKKYDINFLKTLCEKMESWNEVAEKIDVHPKNLLHWLGFFQFKTKIKVEFLKILLKYLKLVVIDSSDVRREMEELLEEFQNNDVIKVYYVNRMIR